MTILSLGLSISSQEGIWPFVTIKIFLTHGACFSTERREYFSSSLSAKRLAEMSASSFESSLATRTELNGAHINEAGANFAAFPLIVNFNFRAEEADVVSEKYATPMSFSAWKTTLRSLSPKRSLNSFFTFSTSLLPFRSKIMISVPLLTAVGLVVSLVK